MNGLFCPVKSNAKISLKICIFDDRSVNYSALFQFRRKLLLKFDHFGRNHELAITLFRVESKIIVMHCFSWPESSGGANLGANLSGIFA